MTAEHLSTKSDNKCSTVIRRYVLLLSLYNHLHDICDICINVKVYFIL